MGDQSAHSLDASTRVASGAFGGVRPANSPVPDAVNAVLPARLAQLGFTAYGTGASEHILPPVVAVPAGDFLMGSDPKRDSVAANKSWARREQPQHKLNLPDFQIARFPVTVAEYAGFVRAGHAAPKNPTGTLDWEAQLHWLDHPVIFVSGMTP
ncbi:MAG TPA: SUMF1/EgtB/PvdO family nonheme iron enzyme [Ktedonobacterales bacterium]